MATSTTDDLGLIQRFLDHQDPRAFRELMDRYKNKVFRLAISILGPGYEAEAEEVTQDVFVVVFRKLATFRAEARFSSWLYRIAYNRAVDRKNTARFRVPHVSDDVLQTYSVDRAQGDPFAVAESNERRALFRECVEQLPEVYRAAVHLHYWLGWSVGEIGAVLGAPDNTVKSYLHRARARLEKMLRKRGIRDA